jgi:hypothetical protein
LRALAPVLLLLTFLLPACARSSVYKVPIAGFDESAPSAALAIDISCPRGTVTVEAGPWVKHASVAARAYDADDQPLTQESWVSADMAQENGRSVLRILCGEPAGTQTSDPKYIIRVRAPSIEGLRIRNGGGKIDVSGVSGALDIQNTGPGGKVRVKSKRSINDPVLITTTKGDVIYQIAEGSSGSIDASANNGEVRVRSPRGTINSLEVTRDTWHAVWNEGTNSVVIRTDNGDVYLNLGYYE